MARAITRRRFVETTSAGALGLSADWCAGPITQAVPTPAPVSTGANARVADDVEDRVRAVLHAYDAQGVHRTGDGRRSPLG